MRPGLRRGRVRRDPRRTRLWAVAAGGRERGPVHHVRFSFGKPQSPRDWRSFGRFGAFIVALSAEMYGFPLSIYLLSGWLQTRYPGLDLMSRDAGHLWSTVLGLSGNPHFSVLHILSLFAIGGGFLLLGSAWPILLTVQKQDRLATPGVYGQVRYPQYVGFIVILFGFLLQWPTILTLLMFPALVVMYVRLAHAEEARARLRFGNAYVRYAARVPGWLPRLQSPTTQGGPA